MIALLIGVFLFFWTHTALWFYREWRDRKEGKSRTHVEVPAERAASNTSASLRAGVSRISCSRSA